MEYIHGVTLRQKLQASGKLPTEEALAILRQILWALVHAHEHGVLHRNLKPENVLLTASGQVKVTDFGLGKVQAEVAQSIIMSGSLASNDGRNLSGTIRNPRRSRGAASDDSPRRETREPGATVVPAAERRKTIAHVVRRGNTTRTAPEPRRGERRLPPPPRPYRSAQRDSAARRGGFSRRKRLPRPLKPPLTQTRSLLPSPRVPRRSLDSRRRIRAVWPSDMQLPPRPPPLP